MISFFWKFIRERRKKSVLAFLLLGIVSLTSLVFPLFLQLMIDHLEHRREISFSMELISSGFLALILIATCAGYFELRLFHDLGIGLRNTLRIRYFSSLLKNDLLYFQRTPLGELSSSVIDDSVNVQSFFSHVAAPSIQNALFIIGCLTMMYLLHPLTTVYIVLLLSSLLPPIILISRRVKIAAENSQRALARSHSIFEQTFLGIAEVLSFNAKDFFQRKYIDSLQESRKVEQQAYSNHALITQFLYFIVSFILLFVLSVASSGSMQKEMPLSKLVAFYFYCYTLVMAIFSSGKLFIAAKEISGKIRRMLVMIHDNEEEQVDSVLPDRSLAHGAIELRDVNFTYENGKPVFQNLNLWIHPGEWLIISGASGSGKSTLAKLIKGLYLPTHGDVFLDGCSTKNFGRSFYRIQIGYVGQETILFNLSIRDNILLGRTDVDNADLEKLLAICCVHPFVGDLPAGIDTIIGEQGCTLSVGQKNRIAIARALVLNPPILIIDEASTALDIDTERAIWENIFSFRAHRTTIVCTHHHENLPPSVRHLSLDEWKSPFIVQPNLQPESMTITHA